MIGTLLDELADFVTTHDRVVIVVFLVLTAGMAVGATNLDTASQADGTDAFPDTPEAEAADYVADHYGSGDERTYAPVYVRDEGGNALSKPSLVAALEYQRDVLANDSVAAATADDRPVVGVANLVAAGAADDPDPDLDEQLAALESASEAEIERLVRTTLRDAAAAPGTDDAEGDGVAAALLPERSEPGAASAESHRMLFAFEGGDAPGDARLALYEAASDREDPRLFTLGEHATADDARTTNENTLGLILPIALALVLGALAFAYRDPVDVVVGTVGVAVSLVWMFGILGWLDIGAGMTAIVGPVLIAGLSIDFGFHVFMRYRERREATDGIREPMARALRSVGLALALVTATAGIGFLANAVNPVGEIRDLGVGITAGVVSAFVVFVTLIPALKVRVDGLLERVGVDRRGRPLGRGRYLRPLLRSSVTVARRAAPLVVAVALVAALAGGAAWTALDEESFQQRTEPVADWKTDLPGPLAWEETSYQHDRRHVVEQYRAASAGDGERFQLLVDGEVTEGGALHDIERATDGSAFDGAVETPATVVRSVAATDESFAATVAAADETGDGLPDTDLETVYDRLYEVAPAQAATVIERTDGEYRSLRVVGPAESAGLTDERVDDVEAIAGAVEDGETDLTATPASEAAILEAQLEAVTDGILAVLVLALAAVSGTLVVVFRRVHGSATLGAITALPIAAVTGLVVGGMYLLEIPLTLVTALLVSLVIGLGIDYSIHVSDRFAQELDRGRDGFAALETAVTGTGAALLGSAVTSGAAFASLLVHPHPQLYSFGVLVVLGLFASFFVSVFVLPSALAIWWRRVRTDRSESTDPAAESATPND